MDKIPPLENLIQKFTKLPGVGKKTAARYAYAILAMTDEDSNSFIDAIREVKEKVHFCKVCGNYTDDDVCEICSSRDNSIVCVVSEPKEVTAMEKIKDYNGVYHVLHGLLNPMAGVGPEDLNIKALLDRISGVKEIIVATASTIEGDATALYLSRLLKPLGVKVTRIARGLPAGSELEYADELTLSRALTDRKEI